ncbi:hypothetical protein [Planococcus donghaensis]|uniref:hypothetical protein n=1 Tax=Planococcus donghaensis TaxID=414778 RepID=UPI0037354DD4
MKKETIKILLETMCEYPNVRITQIFAKEDIEWIRVKYIPDTQILELTFLETENVECYDAIPEAVKVISEALSFPPLH